MTANTNLDASEASIDVMLTAASPSRFSPQAGTWFHSTSIFQSKHHWHWQKASAYMGKAKTFVFSPKKEDKVLAIQEPNIYV